MELQQRERVLEDERERLAATAIELGKERNALAVSRAAVAHIRSEP